MKAPRWLLVVTALALALAFFSPAKAVLTGAMRFLRPQTAMPSLERYEAVDGGPVFCSNGRVLLKVYYNEKGTDPKNTEVTAFYLTAKDIQDGKPWIMAVWPSDSADDAKAVVYLDRDRNGYADLVSDISTMPNACQVQALDQRLWYRVTPVTNASRTGESIF